MVSDELDKIPTKQPVQPKQLNRQARSYKSFNNLKPNQYNSHSRQLNAAINIKVDNQHKNPELSTTSATELEYQIAYKTKSPVKLTNKNMTSLGKLGGQVIVKQADELSQLLLDDLLVEFVSELQRIEKKKEVRYK